MSESQFESRPELKSDSPRIAEFFAQAQAAAIPHSTLVGMLTARGWREKDVFLALSDHYRATDGIEIPPRAAAGAAAKDAFFYLLIFSTLATWTLSLGSLAFQLLDRWLHDPLFSAMPEQFATVELTWSLAAILIAFPLFLLLSRAVHREAALIPEKLDSGIRKWLTYLALVVAASVFMGDLISALAYLLRGELTSRFLAKSLVVLVLSGGVFFHYFGGLRRTALPGSFHRDRLMAAVSSAVVAVMLILGFLQLGPPRGQRDLRADARRLGDLYRMSAGISNYYRDHAQKLPPSASQIPGGAPIDPITHAPYEYQPVNGDAYSLCATFAREDQFATPGINQWSHPAGHHCFPLNAAISPQYPTGVY